jgi:uncharacterized membrane protein YbhN (UPF0104 family)
MTAPPAAPTREEQETDEPRAGGRLRDILGVVLSLISIGAVGWWASRQEAPDFPTSLSALLPLAAAVGVYALATLTRGWRWHSILGRSQVNHERRDAYGLTVVGYMGNAVLPARGGEILRILLLHERSDARRREILGTIVAERLLDVATLLFLLVVLSWSQVGGAPAGQTPAAVGIAGAVGLTLALFVYLRLRRRGLFEGFAAAIRPFVRASRLLWDRFGLLLFLVTFGVWVLESLNFWLIAEALDIGIDPLEAMLLIVLTSFIVAVPAAPGYLGTFDAALLFVLDALGVGGGEAIAFLLLVRFVVFVPITAAGLGLMVARYGGLHRLLRRGRPVVSQGS